jgi:antitoxin component of MazEF toxin-antitoxin module
MIRKIFKTGHSYAVTLSKKIMEELGLKAGDGVSLEVDSEGKRLVMKKEAHKNQLELGLTIRPSLGSAIKNKK